MLIESFKCGYSPNNILLLSLPNLSFPLYFFFPSKVLEGVPKGSAPRKHWSGFFFSGIGVFIFIASGRFHVALIAW